MTKEAEYLLKKSVNLPSSAMRWCSFLIMTCSISFTPYPVVQSNPYEKLDGGCRKKKSEKESCWQKGVPLLVVLLYVTKQNDFPAVQNK